MSLLSVLWAINTNVSSVVPQRGGSYTEGVIGFPRFANPVLATAQADKDVSELVYAGLFTRQANGRLTYELADAYSVSDDGLVYNVTLRDGITFHDGEPVTAEDVVFTIKQIQDPTINSPLLRSFEGVTAEILDPRTIVFTLDQAYSGFLADLTVGILPAHRWRDIEADQFAFSQYNTRPVGAGPYQLADISRNNQGIATSYVLSSFDNYVNGQPYLDTLRFRFYQNQELLQEAFRDNDVDGFHVLDAAYADYITNEHDDHRLLQAPLGRVFAVYLNQSQNEALVDNAVRQALSITAPREEVVSDVLYGLGDPVSRPLPPLFELPISTATSTPTEGTRGSVVTEADKTLARELLSESGWTLPETGSVRTNADDEALAFVIKTSEVEDLQKTAEHLKESWEDIGVSVSIETYDITTLNQEVIRPREFEMLLFGNVVGAPQDLYAFWHSSQQADPGLNIATYANSDIDEQLEELYATLDPETQSSLLEDIAITIAEDAPAIFLYSPHFLYTYSDEFENVEMQHVRSPEDRFANIHEWYRFSERIWNFFLPESEHTNSSPVRNTSTHSH